MKYLIAKNNTGKYVFPLESIRISHLAGNEDKIEIICLYTKKIFNFMKNKVGVYDSEGDHFADRILDIKMRSYESDFGGCVEENRKE